MTQRPAWHDLVDSVALDLERQGFLTITKNEKGEVILALTEAGKARAKNELRLEALNAQVKGEKYILVIAPDGTETKQPNKPEYKELQALTSGGHANTLIERTKVQYLGKRCDCIVNEEGILLRLPLNSKATALYQADWLKSYPGAPLSDAALFGVAVIFYGWRF